MPEGVRRSGVFTLVGAGSQGAVRLLTVLAIGRLAGAVALGTYGSVIAVAQFLCLMLPSTAGSAASKFLAQARNDDDIAAQVNAHLRRRVRAAIVVLAPASAAVLSVVLTSFDLVAALSVALLVSGMGLYFHARGSLLGTGRARVACRWDVLTALAGGMGTVALAVTGYQGVGLVLPLAAGYLAFGLVNRPAGKAAELSGPLRRQVDEFLVLGVVGTLSSAGLIHLGILVSNRVLGALQAGYYVSAVSLSLPIMLITSALSAVLFPAMTASWASGELRRFGDLLDQATRVLLTVVGGIVGGLFLLRDDLVETLLGSAFAPATAPFSLLLLSVLLLSIASPSTIGLTAADVRGVRRSAVSSVAGFSVGCISWIALVPILGVVGVGLGQLLGTAVLTGAPLVLASRNHNLAWRSLLAKLAGGGLLLVSCELARSQLDIGGTWLALAFVVFWLGSGWRDVGLALPRRGAN